MPPRRKSAAAPELSAAEKNLAATDESAIGGRIKRSAGSEFEYAADHASDPGDGDAPIVWNPHAAGFVIDRDAPRIVQPEVAGGGLQLSPEVPQGDPEKTGTENVVEQQAAVDAADTLPDQYAPGTPGVPSEPAVEPRKESTPAEPTA